MTQDTVDLVAALAAKSAETALAELGGTTTVVPLVVAAGYVHQWVEIRVSADGLAPHDWNEVERAGRHLAEVMVGAGVRAFMPLRVPTATTAAFVDRPTCSLRAVYQYAYDDAVGDFRHELQIAMAGTSGTSETADDGA